jgi:integrase
MQESAVFAARAVPGLEAARHTLADVLERYRREVLPRKAQGTQRMQAGHLAWWKNALGYLRLVDLAPARLVECRDQLAQTRTPGTVNHYLATLGHALAVAVREWQWLEASPLRRVQKLRLPPPRTRYLSDAERQRLLAACQASANRMLYPVVLVALTTGCRKMEILSLTWPDVDLHRRELRVSQTKNGRPRVVPPYAPG